jgi:hypothetical protein
MDELKSVNLSKFVSEAVSYICEAKLRSADIQAAVQVICNSSGYSLIDMLMTFIAVGPFTLHVQDLSCV